jgi:phosphoribosylanthranilate isomerase
MIRIKICGLFREDDISFANDAGPDYIGFVFAESRRQVSPVQAAKLRERLRGGIVPVGVFVNAALDDIVNLFRDGVIGMAQLHGDEDGKYISALKQRAATVASNPVPVIKAVRVNSRKNILAEAASGANYLLLDHGAGGTGKSFDWTLLKTGDLFGELPLPSFLAGGIDEYNIEEALGFKPFGIDISSGTETGGVKDRDKMIRLVEIVRSHI